MSRHRRLRSYRTDPRDKSESVSTSFHSRSDSRSDLRDPFWTDSGKNTRPSQGRSTSCFQGKARTGNRHLTRVEECRGGSFIFVTSFGTGKKIRETEDGDDDRYYLRDQNFQSTLIWSGWTYERIVADTVYYKWRYISNVIFVSLSVRIPNISYTCTPTVPPFRIFCVWGRMVRS